MRYATLDQSVICEQMRHTIRNGKRVKVFTRFTNGKFDGYYSVPARMAGHAVPHNTAAHTLLGMTVGEAR